MAVLSSLMGRQLWCLWKRTIYWDLNSHIWHDIHLWHTTVTIWARCY